MKMLYGEEPGEFMWASCKEAEKSKCQKAWFGAVIVKDGRIIAKGYNRLVGRESCGVCLRKQAGTGKGERIELCYAVHAEQNALLDALEKQENVSGGLMYIGHIEEGNTVEFSGKPYCTVCSRLIAASKLKGVVFYSGKGYVFLGAREFNDKSFETITGYK